MKILIATRNAKKGLEMSQLIAPPWEPAAALGSLRVLTLSTFPSAPEVVEDSDSFSGNASKKASETAIALGLWTVADDSGLAVDALKGAPGVLSARYSGEHGDDASNNRKLLQEMEGVPDERRTAAFVCALALADPAGEIRFEAQAACRGRILREIRGSHGFGYDPMFLIPEYHHTFGELPAIVKHQISHRSRAFVKLRRALIRLSPEIGD